MRVVAPFAVVLAIPLAAAADQIVLKSGGRLSGILVERTATHVVLQVGPGLVSVPAASVVRVVTGQAPLGAYRERAAQLSPADRQGWLALGLWARDQGLDTQARDCFETVLALDPQDPTAQAALGNVLLNGRWVSPEEGYRSRGYIRFEGGWMLPEERDEIVRDRAERRADARARAESEARIAEAEARARAAEAAARSEQATGSGLPLGYALYGGAAPYVAGRGLGLRRSGLREPGSHRPPAMGTPPPPAPTSSFGPTPATTPHLAGSRDPRPDR